MYTMDNIYKIPPKYRKLFVFGDLRSRQQQEKKMTMSRQQEVLKSAKPFIIPHNKPANFLNYTIFDKLQKLYCNLLYYKSNKLANSTMNIQRIITRMLINVQQILPQSTHHDLKFMNSDLPATKFIARFCYYSFKHKYLRTFNEFSSTNIVFKQSYWVNQDLQVVATPLLY